VSARGADYSGRVGSLHFAASLLVAKRHSAATRAAIGLSRMIDFAALAARQRCATALAKVEGTC